MTKRNREMLLFFFFVLANLKFNFDFNWSNLVRLKPRNWNWIELISWVNNLDWTVCLAHSKGCFLSVAGSGLVLSWQQCNEINLVSSTFLIYFLMKHFLFISVLFKSGDLIVQQRKSYIDEMIIIMKKICPLWCLNLVPLQ